MVGTPQCTVLGPSAHCHLSTGTAVSTSIEGLPSHGSRAAHLPPQELYCMFLRGIESQSKTKNRLVILGTSSTTSTVCPLLRVEAAKPRQRLSDPFKESMAIDSLVCPLPPVPTNHNVIIFNKKPFDAHGYGYRSSIS